MQPAQGPDQDEDRDGNTEQPQQEITAHRTGSFRIGFFAGLIPVAVHGSLHSSIVSQMEPLRRSHRSDDMNDLEKDLIDVEVELAKGKQVLRAAKKKAKNGKARKLERDNAERALDAIKDGVKLVEKRRDALQEQVDDEA
jgi:hypothetical protein